MAADYGPTDGEVVTDMSCFCLRKLCNVQWILLFLKDYNNAFIHVSLDIYDTSSTITKTYHIPLSVKSYRLTPVLKDTENEAFVCPVIFF